MTRNEISTIVSDIWTDVLDVTDASEADNFFTVGGTSLAVLELQERIEDELRIEFPIEVIFLEGDLGHLIDECAIRAGANVD